MSGLVSTIRQQLGFRGAQVGMWLPADVEPRNWLPMTRASEVSCLVPEPGRLGLRWRLGLLPVGQAGTQGGGRAASCS